MKKMIVVAVILSLLVGGGIANVSASFWGNIDAEMDGNVIVIGGQQMSDDEINKKIANLFAEPLTPPICDYEDYEHHEYCNCYGCWDWLGCP